MRRTKIVCTIGPACSSRRTLELMLRAGMDVARLNFSHGTHEEHAAAIARLRALSAGRDRPLAILQDLSGPKVRIGVVPGDAVALRRGQLVTLSGEASTDDSQDRIPLPVPQLIDALAPGHRLLLDDGRIELRVTGKQGSDVTARVAVGGVLTSHKGVTAPGVTLNIEAVTPKDLDDLRFGMEQGVDWVAASYVRDPEDIQPLRSAMDEAGVRLPILAKIEKMEAVRSIAAIIESVDGIMVARGDLGVEIPIDEVPIVQKRVIRLCNRACKPVVTATQMLESMVHNPRPTRAEVTDVANAIIDGSDAVMLSGETAAGEYPIQAVRTMARVAERTDCCFPHRPGAPDLRGSASGVTEAVAQATVAIAAEVRAAAILTATTSGSTARLIAKYRPTAPIIAVSPREETYRRLAFTWGARPLLIEPVTGTDDMMAAAVRAVVERKIARDGDRVVLTAGVPVNVVGKTNLIRVHTIGEPLVPEQAGGVKLK